ncbi:MAG: alpha/beta hydrolase [Desulfocapsaceae bacterium]
MKVNRKKKPALYLILATACIIFSAEFASPASGDEAHREDTTGSAQLTETFTVPYVTLRDKNKNSSTLEKYFDGTRDISRFGTCEVSFSPIKSLQSIAEATPFYIPDQRTKLTALQELSFNQFFKDLSVFARSDDGNIVVYIHGYNISFWKSCRRSAMFQKALELQERLLLFSWPADGNALKYTWDESDLHWSVAYIARLLEELIARRGEGGVDVVAHSLGARGAFLALSQMADRQPDRLLINEMILIAPDIDTDIFEQKISALRRAAKRISVYVSENDRALKFAQEVHGYPRLGQAGKNLRVMKGIEMIDISQMSAQRISGHLYHLFNPQVAADIKRLLHTGEHPDQRPSLRSQTHNGLPFWQMIPDDIGNKGIPEADEK